MNTDTQLNTKSSSRMRPDTLAASVTILLVANIVQRSIGFGRGILFCRWLSPDELGTWDMAYSFLLLAAPVVVLGLPGSFGRYLERYRQRGQLRTFLRRATIWTFVLTIAALRIDCRRGAAVFGSDLRPARLHDAGRDGGPQPGRGHSASLSGSVVRGAAQVQHRFDDAFLPKHFVRCHFAGLDVVVAVLAAESIVIGYGAACLAFCRRRPGVERRGGS